jgi:hypothetical protein
MIGRVSAAQYCGTRSLSAAAGQKNDRVGEIERTDSTSENVNRKTPMTLG